MLIVCCVQVPKLPALSMMLNAGTLECYQKLIESHGTTIPYKPTQNKNLVFLHTTPSAEASVTSRTYSTRTSCRSSPKRRRGRGLQLGLGRRGTRPGTLASVWSQESRRQRDFPQPEAGVEELQATETSVMEGRLHTGPGEASSHPKRDGSAEASLQTHRLSGVRCSRSAAKALGYWAAR